MCSGCCAWGEGTTDGRLVTGSTTDHDCTYQATIIAFPDTGNSFIYTPFSVNGFVPVLGHFYMAGHPGMNNKGLAYVHHGGGFHFHEPIKEWGYGLRRGTTTFHILRYANNSQQARDMELSWAVGDNGTSLGSPGGFYADSTYGYVLESRAGAPDSPSPIIREHSYDEEGNEYDFLYATNNMIAHASGETDDVPAGTYGLSVEGYTHSVIGGWYTHGPMKVSGDTPVQAWRRMNTKDSECRNRHLFNTLKKGYGKVSVEYMKMVYRRSGTIPPGPYAEVAAYWEAGEQWDCSAAHRGNAFTAVTKPDNGNEGIYLGCIGPAKRSLQIRAPSHGYYYYDETNAFWNLKLVGSPSEVAAAAKVQAQADMNVARAEMAKLSSNYAGLTALNTLYKKAENDHASGMDALQRAESMGGNNRLYKYAKATRAFTRSQVRVRQIINALVPPPDRPGAFGL
jgi:hypothetical protein